MLNATAAAEARNQLTNTSATDGETANAADALLDSVDLATDLSGELF